MTKFPQAKIELYRALFKGREDIFAQRWQKGNKAGYMPAYSYDPYLYRAHKRSGGTFSTFIDKTYLPLDDEQIIKHLNGHHCVGIYPLLKNNTSWFLVADFDKGNWQDDIKSFYSICEANGLHAYIERSRSGNGGHVWFFFEKEYAAYKSRKIALHLLEKAGVVSTFDRSASFDRLFPNQNSHSGKGFGNLIALPLNGLSFLQSNTCFLNPTTLTTFKDQWDILSKIKRNKTELLDNIYNTYEYNANVDNNFDSGNLKLILSNNILINRNHLSLELINFIKEEYNIPNPEFYIKKRSGKNTWHTQRFFNLIKEDNNQIILPRGTIRNLFNYLNKKGVKFSIDDKRTISENIEYEFNTKLLAHQEKIVKAIDKKDFGVIVSPPGSGKTIVALKIIKDKKQPALIIVHRQYLLDQWAERVQAFLKIPKHEIGIIGKGKMKIGTRVTIAMIQSLTKKSNALSFLDFYKTLIIDECHHIPANSYNSVITNLKPYYQYGLTATPFRKYSGNKLIFAYLGELIHEVKSQDIENFKTPIVKIRNTALDVPFDAKIDSPEVLSKIIIHDSNRNKLIVNDVLEEIQNGRQCLIITERKDHIRALNLLLKNKSETITLHGEQSAKEKKESWSQINSNDYQVIITTGQFFGEGYDIKNISCLFLVYPFSFKGKLIQYIGRIQRTDLTPKFYDYRDKEINYLDKLFLKRNVHYRHFHKQATLFDDPKEAAINQFKTIQIARQINLSIVDLDFNYGFFSFNHTPKEIDLELTFHIYNDYIRSEFEVLKPYFNKVLGFKTHTIQIRVELERSIIVSQSAECKALKEINRNSIDLVRFKFIDINLLKDNKSRQLPTKAKLIGNSNSLFNSELELLNEILKNKKAKHYQQLTYLANKHCFTIQKLKYITHPFSFIFLLSGEKSHHVILETLDTEEATYIWHFSDLNASAENQLEFIDVQINFIKNFGRTKYLKRAPVNFSKIVHNYSNDKKGFIIWRDDLEQRLY